MRRSFGSVMGLAVVAGLCVVPSLPAQAAPLQTWVVTTSVDNDFGCAGGAAAPVDGSLRWAIDQWSAASHAVAGDYAILIETTEPIVLSDCGLLMTPPPDGTSTLTVSGTGQDGTVIQAGAAEFGLYAGSQAPTGGFAFQDMTIIGDDIFLETFGADLTLSRMAIKDVNGATSDSDGVHIGRSPKLTIQDVAFEVHDSSLALGGGFDGVPCSTSVTDSSIAVHGESELTGHGISLPGGCDYTFSSVTVTDTRAAATQRTLFYGSGFGGSSLGSVSFDHVTAASPAAYFAGEIAGDLTITDSAFSWTGDPAGGAPYNSMFEARCANTETGCALTVQRSFIEAIASSHTPDVFYGWTFAGTGTAPVVVENSTFHLLRQSWFDGVPSLFSFYDMGGAGASVALRNNTVLGDEAVLIGAAYNSSPLALELDNNVVSNASCSVVSASDPQLVTITGAGNYVVSNTPSTNWPCVGNIALPDSAVTVLSLADMKIGTLGDHGGPTPTYLPQPGSPLIDGGVTPTAAAPGGAAGADELLVGDQRSFQRVQGSAIDAGAVEIQAGTVEPVADQTAEAGDPLIFTLRRAGGSEGSASVSVVVTDGTAKAGVNFTATAPATVTWADGDSADKTVTIPTIKVADGQTVQFQVGIEDAVAVGLGAKTTVTGTIINPAGDSALPTTPPATGSPTAPGVPTAPAVPTVPTDSSTNPPSLAVTGTTVSGLVLVAVLLTGVGAILVRRRRSA